MSSLNIDIIIVTYNSAKWIYKCLESIAFTRYNHKNIFLTIVDNDSCDDSIRIAEDFDKASIFGGFNILKEKHNHGFGKGNNIGVKNSCQDYILLLNVDTELEPDSLQFLVNRVIKSDGNIALWELRQFPYEHPKIYNPLTFETSWSSAAACLIKRSAYLEIGGFDEQIFMYGEDVDLSWRLKEKGYKLVYVPESTVYHFTFDRKQSEKEKPDQYYYSVFSNLLLRYKFGSFFDVIKGYLLCILLILKGRQINRIRLLALLSNSIPKGVTIRKGRKGKRMPFWGRGRNGDLYKFKIWDYEIERLGAKYKNTPVNGNPLVSVIVRTCNRPQMLREALLSIKNQTYKHIEIIVIEDGQNFAESLIQVEFFDLAIKYVATGMKVGRTKAANLGLSLAKGEYFNFLDDDDLFYPDHIEVLLSALTNNSNYLVAYSLAFETPISVQVSETRNIKYNLIFNERFNILTLLERNFLPIQTVMFSGRLYKQFGGLDEALDVLEDWHLWLKYAFKCNSFLFIPKITSLYKVPPNRRDRKRRKDFFKNASMQVYKLIQQEYLTIKVEDYKNYKEQNAKIRKFKDKLIRQFNNFLRNY
ncbi:glycosyltransferase [Paenibacillus sp. S-38]|uniref:glycosyltransferase n=1 Tax=Paenibacillus sp. S-38 TaxID=3416710 RepID=UPI003CFBC077